MSKEVQRALGRTITVADMRALLEGYPDDTPIMVSTCYGDYERTQQALPIVEEAHEAPIHTLVPSAYSNSGVALKEDGPDEEVYCEKCEKTAAYAPRCPRCGGPVVNEGGEPVEADGPDGGPTEVLIFKV